MAYDATKHVIFSQKITTHKKGNKEFLNGRVEEKPFSDDGKAVVKVKDIDGNDLE